MAIERTFGIVKPDAVEKGAVGGVVDMIEKAGFFRASAQPMLGGLVTIHSGWKT